MKGESNQSKDDLFNFFFNKIVRKCKGTQENLSKQLKVLKDSALGKRSNSEHCK